MSSVVLTWEISSLDQLGLFAKATAVVGQAGRLYYSEAGTLFLSRQGENVAVWNPRGLGRISVVTFPTDSSRIRGLTEILERRSEDRIIKLSPSQQRLFCDIFQRIASESSNGSPVRADAASPWLTIQLVMRWFVGTRSEGFEVNADRQCYELWLQIRQHANQTKSAEPMLLYRDASYDSLRHRFQKAFGESPRALLVRLRMTRANELLRTTDMSVKEVAGELGYSKQHEFTRAFTRFFGESPSQWRATSLPKLTQLECGPFGSNPSTHLEQISSCAKGSSDSAKDRLAAASYFNPHSIVLPAPYETRRRASIQTTQNRNNIARAVRASTQIEMT